MLRHKAVGLENGRNQRTGSVEWVVRHTCTARGNRVSKVHIPRTNSQRVQKIALYSLTTVIVEDQGRDELYIPEKNDLQCISVRAPSVEKNETHEITNGCSDCAYTNDFQYWPLVQCTVSPVHGNSNIEFDQKRS